MFSTKYFTHETNKPKYIISFFFPWTPTRPLKQAHAIFSLLFHKNQWQNRVNIHTVKQWLYNSLSHYLQGMQWQWQAIMLTSVYPNDKSSAAIHHKTHYCRQSNSVNNSIHRKRNNFQKDSTHQECTYFIQKRLNHWHIALDVLSQSFIILLLTHE